MNIQCIIVDDDPMMVRVLESFVEKTDFLDLVATCSNPLEATPVLQENDIDLLLLDVEMPEMTGIEWLETLRKKPQVILITSKDQYAVAAFEHDVVDYIVKPPQYPRFLKAVTKALENLTQTDDGKPKNQLFVKVDSRLVKIEMSDILFVEAKADYVTIHTPEKRYTVYSTMKGIVGKLSQDDFIRVHRSYIINRNKIDSIEDNTLVIGEKLTPVGVTYKERLMDRLNLL